MVTDWMWKWEKESGTTLRFGAPATRRMGLPLSEMERLWETDFRGEDREFRLGQCFQVETLKRQLDISTGLDVGIWISRWRS